MAVKGRTALRQVDKDEGVLLVGSVCCSQPQALTFPTARGWYQQTNKINTNDSCIFRGFIQMISLILIQMQIVLGLT